MLKMKNSSLGPRGGGGAAARRHGGPRGGRRLLPGRRSLAPRRAHLAAPARRLRGAQLLPARRPRDLRRASAPGARVPGYL